MPRCESLEARTLLSFAPDPTFGMAGQVQTALTATGGPQSVAVQPDGKILAIGSVMNPTTGQDFAVVRYNPDGSLDPSFGSGGMVTTDFSGGSDQGTSLAIESNGQIVVAGTSLLTSGGFTRDFVAMARYDANGQLDSSFGSGGKVISSSLFGAEAMVIEPGSKIVLAGGGEGSTMLARFNADGSLDTTFANSGLSAPLNLSDFPGFNDLALQEDGKIVGVGDVSRMDHTRYDFIVRYSADGTLDPGFGNGGIITGPLSESLNAVAIQADGKIVATGSDLSDSKAIEMRLNPDGSADPTFHAAIPFSSADSVAIQPDGKIVVSGFTMGGANATSSPALVRQNPDGSADLGFDPEGILISPGAAGQGLTLQPDGKIVVASLEPGDIVSLSRFGPGPSIYAVGADAGGGPEIKVYDTATGALKLDFFAYDPNFKGGVRVAVGDVNGDGVPDIITAPGPGGGPEVKVFDGVTGKVLMDFMAFDPNFSGGVFVAAGDVNGDGHADIIAGADAGGGPEVQVFSGADGKVVQSFFAYDPSFLGGVRVAAGDVTGSGTADIITAPGPGGGPNVKVFDGNGNVLQSFFAYDPNFVGGVYVASADVNSDGHADIITGAGAGGGPNVKVFSGVDDTALESFFAYDPNFHGGVRVGALTTSTGAAELLTGAGPGGGPAVGVLSANGQTSLDGFFAYDPNFPGGVFVGGA
jgi:uncharacterized delta-60 repeat protein